MQKQENSPVQPGGRVNDENMMSTQERQRRTSPLPTFPLIIKL